MGLNIYAIKNISDDTVGLLNKYKKTGYVKFFYQFLDKINVECSKIHIGKSSCGWKFLFNHNNWKYYDYTKDSINKFLESCAGLVNEYNEVVTIKEFWDMVEAHKNGFNGEEYFNWEVERSKNGENDFLNEDTAKELLENAKSRNWYEESICKGKQIPYDELDYRFSISTDFC